MKAEINLSQLSARTTYLAIQQWGDSTHARQETGPEHARERVKIKKALRAFIEFIDKEFPND